MKKKQTILIVDNNMHISFYPQKFLFKRLLNSISNNKIIIKKPYRLNSSDLNVDKIILTGSTSNVREERPWMKKEQQFITEWIERKKPILGICFGAQIIARTVYGPNSIESLPIPTSGSLKMNITKPNIPLFSGIPKTIGVMATHSEGFIIPKENIIGETKEWPNYAFLIKNNIYGLQFHPELMNIFGKLFLKIQKLFYDRHVYQNFDVKTKQKYGKQIFHNFLKL